jgi:opacity protein-like surface antigen
MCVPALLLTIALVAFAATANAGNISGYAGAGIGLATSKFDQEHFDFDTDDLTPSETAWRLFGGARLHPNFGLEIGYVGLGKAKAMEQVQQLYFECDLTGVDVAALGYLPLASKLSGFARLGLIFWSSDIAFELADDFNGTGSATGSGLAFGLGAQYDIHRSVGVRAEYTRYAVDKGEAGLGDFNFIGLSIFAAFGRTE